MISQVGSVNYLNNQNIKTNYRPAFQSNLVSFQGDRFEPGRNDEKIIDTLLAKDSDEWKSPMSLGITKTKVSKVTNDPKLGKVTVILNAKTGSSGDQMDGYEAVVGSQLEAAIELKTPNGDYHYISSKNQQSDIFRLAKNVIGDAEYARLQKMCSLASQSQNDGELLATKLLEKDPNAWRQPLTNKLNRYKAVRTTDNTEFGKVTISLNTKTDSSGNPIDGYEAIVGSQLEAAIEYTTPGSCYHYLATKDPESPIFKLAQKAVGDESYNRLKNICDLAKESAELT